MQPGALLSAGGQSEFWRMIGEKQAAAAESYFSLLMSAVTLSQQMFFGAWAAWARGQPPRAAGTAAKENTTSSEAQNREQAKSQLPTARDSARVRSQNSSKSAGTSAADR